MQLVEFFRSRRGGELIGIVIVAIGITLGAAILTYHPRDSSAFYTSTDIEIRNAIGYYGATLAWIFVSFFGFASLLFPGVLLAAGWSRFWGRDIDYFHTKLIGFIVLVLSLPPLFDLALGKLWLRGSLIAAGGYLGQEINRAVSGNMNTSGAVIVLVTSLLIGILLATRISLAAVFLALHQQLLAFGRSVSLYWARWSERRRKDKMKVAIVKKHLDKVEAPPLRLVPAPADEEVLRSPVVREVKGAGKFQIRKVTKADLRKAAEALSQQETRDPFELYRSPSGAAASQPARPAAPVSDGLRARPSREIPEPEPVDDLEFEDPLFEDLPEPVLEKPKPVIPRPAMRKKEPPKREIKLTHDLLPPVNLLTEGPKQNTINDEVHKKFL
ncbi:MAG TPA: DNA translocase FtsK 4TM domain-containing protein, partial [Thermoanaerobaculia bacterium]